MGRIADRHVIAAAQHRTALGQEKAAQLDALEAEHAQLGEKRRAAHAAIFAAKQKLKEAEAAYRDVLQQRVAVQAELEPLRFNPRRR